MEININTGINILTIIILAFNTGIFIQKIRNLEKLVSNGVSKQLDTLNSVTIAQGEKIANIQATCVERGKQLDTLQASHK